MGMETPSKRPGTQWWLPPMTSPDTSVGGWVFTRGMRNKYDTHPVTDVGGNVGGRVLD